MENQNVQVDELGRYNVLLGSFSARGLPMELFASAESRWLGVRPQNGEDEQPRLVLVSVPYALKASDADTLGGKPASAYLTVSSGDEKNASKNSANPDGETQTSNAITPLLFDDGTRVGIGTNNPVRMFEVRGAGDVARIGSIDRFTEFSDTGYLMRFAVNTTAGGPGRFGIRTATTGVDNFMVDSNGYVGVGTLAPLRQFEVLGSGDVARVGSAARFVEFSDTGYHMRFAVNTTAGGPGIFGIRTTNGGVDQFLVDNLGRVGIGTLTPAHLLDVAGNMRVAGNVIFADSTTLSSANTARVRGITYLAGCDTCSALADTDDQKTLYVNVIGAMTVNEVRCFSDAGSPTINIRRNGTVVNMLTSDLACSPTGATTTTLANGEGVLNVGDKLDFEVVTAGGVAKRVTLAVKTTLN